MLTKLAAKKPQSQQSAKVLVDLLAGLRALRAMHQTSHWTTCGSDFYGDHLLFERLYKNIDDEEDKLAEKIVDYFGEDPVQAPMQLSRMAQFVQEWNQVSECPIERSLVAETNIQDIIETAYHGISELGEMSLGLDDFIMSLANNHEEHHYLIQQNQRCECDEHPALQKMRQ